MDIVNEIIKLLAGKLVGTSYIVTVAQIFTMLAVCFAMGLYEFVVYRTVSRRNLYNKAFHITIMIIPFFIGSIVLILQSIMITLGTIGALAIIRFRTAVKDPIDMVYILWSIFIGITCGCEVYNLCVITSLAVTIVLIVINLLGRFSLFRNPYILVINSDEEIEEAITCIVTQHTKNYRIKSRNYTSAGVDYVYEVNVRNVDELTSQIKNLSNVKQFSLIEYDNEDVI